MGTIEIGIISIIFVVIIFQQWKIRSGHYEKTRWTLEKRFLWATICSVLPVLAFIENPGTVSAGVICLVFFYVLFFGSDYKRVSEQSVGVDDATQP